MDNIFEKGLESRVLIPSHLSTQVIQICRVSLGRIYSLSLHQYDFKETFETRLNLDSPYQEIITTEIIYDEFYN